ncbi:MAG: PaaI family thioesterase [Desulfovibrio sp.]|jgi:uncharacterized protein (TIGR00369 family)|nr:PaaI family thioesterase [Desulfovibrio sp.]
MVESHTTLHDRIKTSFDKQAFLALIGAELERVEKGKVVVSCKHRNALTQQQGFLHGGVVSSLADVSCGYAALTTMPDNAEVLTVEFKINLIRPANADKLVASGEVVKSGRTLIIAESTVTDENGEKVIAKMLATMIVSPMK